MGNEIRAEITTVANINLCMIDGIVQEIDKCLGLDKHGWETKADSKK